MHKYRDQYDDYEKYGRIIHRPGKWYSDPVVFGLMVVTMMLSGAIKNALSLVPLYMIAGILLLVSVAIVVPLFKMKD
jgi:hypothetical protein